MTCTHRLFTGPLTCQRTDVHTTHVYHASDCPDRHDEDAAWGGRS